VVAGGAVGGRVRAWLAVVGLGLVGLSVLAGCGPRCRTAGDGGPPNVVLVTLDTTRADRIAAFGGDGAVTPALDRLAAEGAIFLGAYTTSHITLPSHVSIMSSLPVATHGVVTNGRPTRRVAPLLPDLLREAGYQTAAFVSARHLGRGGPLGAILGKSFDVYRSAADWYVPVPGAQTTERVARWMRKACDAPFFAWVHYWDPHAPYTPAPPFAPRDPAAGEPVARHQLGWPLLDLGALRPTLARHAHDVRALKRTLGARGADVERLMVDPDTLPAGAPPAARAAVERLRRAVHAALPLHPGMGAWLAEVGGAGEARARYDGEVSYADREVGRLIDALTDLGLAADTVVVIVADHGESLGEHGIFFDHQGLYEPTVRVPLLVWAPGRVPPARHDGLVSTVDVAPTILRLVGLPVPAAMRGRDLLTGGGAPRDVVSESIDRRQLMLRRGRWKLIRTVENAWYTEAFAPRRGTVELYDLERDPGEERNLAAAAPAVVAELTAALDAWERAALVPAAPPVPDERLRALGYLE